VTGKKKDKPVIKIKITTSPSDKKNRTNAIERLMRKNGQCS